MIRCVIGSGGEKRMMPDPGGADKNALFLLNQEKKKKHLKPHRLIPIVIIERRTPLQTEIARQRLSVCEEQKTACVSVWERNQVPGLAQSICAISQGRESLSDCQHTKIQRREEKVKLCDTFIEFITMHSGIVLTMEDTYDARSGQPGQKHA